jgi:hypothetical protein
MENRNIKFARFLGMINENSDLGLWYLENQDDKDIDFANDWNKVHELKEFIETQYEVFVHILGKGCLITTSCSELIEANDWNDCLVMLEITPEEVEKITAIEWANKVLELFIDKIDNLISAKKNK